MAFFSFSKGNYDNLKNKSIQEGQILICEDSGEMFVDISSTERLKIGDYVIISDLNTLTALDATKIPTSRLYYVEEGNVLARSNGTDWIQINKQPTTSELKTQLGLGSAAYTNTNAYDAAGSAGAVRDYVGEIPSNYTEQNIVAYINKKAEETLNAASGGSTENAASVKAALDAYKSENDPKVATNTEAIAGIKNGATIDSFADVESELGNKVASVTAGNTSITIGGTATAPTIAAKISSDTDNAIKVTNNGLKVVIPAAPEYSIIKAAESGDYAAVYNLTKNGTIVGASINIPKDLVVKTGTVEGDEIVLVLNDEAKTEIKIPVGSLIEYVTSGSNVGDMVVINISDDHKVTATITNGTISYEKLTNELQDAIDEANSLREYINELFTWGSF